jgi:hypothetical protein
MVFVIRKFFFHLFIKNKKEKVRIAIITSGIPIAPLIFAPFHPYIR